MEKITFGILPLRKIRLGSCRLVKRFWESTFHPKRITTSELQKIGMIKMKGVGIAKLYSQLVPTLIYI